MHKSMKSSKDGFIAKGCVIGCLAVLAIVIIISISTFLAVRSAFNKYTDTEAREIPALNVSKAQSEMTIRKYNSFTKKMSNSEKAPTLSLTASEINQLIQYHVDFDEISDKAFVHIKDNKIYGDVSIPLDELGGPFKGRYFNGSAGLSIALKSNMLYIYLDALEVKDNKVPESFINELKKENLAADLNSDPEFKSIFEHVESIEISNNTLRIKPKHITNK